MIIEVSAMTKLYTERDIMALDEAGNYYCKHVSAMTGEKLHSKSDIAAELAQRDYEIDKLKAQVEQLRNAAKIVLNARDKDGITTSGLSAKFDKLFKAVSFVPSQCLAEIKAQAGRDGFVAGVGYAHKRPDVVLPKVIEMVAHDYANQLRQQANRGE